jgi:glycosyltransferase involved in cell wall biosynthesis
MNSINPRVSVVMPTYNQGNFLGEAIDSVLKQTWTDFELIIVNDGSTDQTFNILQDYSIRYPEIRVIHQQNGKLPRALNTGFQAAKGEFLTWTSSDNRMLPQMIETLLASLLKRPDAGMVFSDWNLIREDGEPFGKVVHTFDFNRYLLMRLNFINVSFLYRRVCQETIGLYDPDFLYVEDWEYWLRVSRRFNVFRIPLCLYEFRIHSDSITGDGSAKSQKVSLATLKLQTHLRKHETVGWYWSKFVYEFLRLKKGVDPKVIIQPYFY